METNATGLDLVKLFQAYEEARADNTAHFRKIMALQKRVEELEGELGKPYDKVDRLFEENKKLMAENEKLRETLSKFSDPNFYWTKPPTVEDGWIVYGRAKKMAELLSVAREALGGAGNELQASKESP